jgi:enoyl-[acyl-carrier protein] reductase II
LIKNEFYQRVKELEDRAASREELMELLGRGRAKLGMFEGDLSEGELEIGQIAGLIHEIKPAADIVNEIIEEFEETRKQISAIDF